MKKCPSCNAQRDDAEEVCGVCGHVFKGDDNRKQTMMGFPSLAAALEEAEAMEPEEPAKQTLFGFPAQKGEQGAAPEPEEDEEEFEATSIIPPSAFSFDDNDDDDDDPMRGTVAGMSAPSIDESYDEDDATAIVAGQASFPPPLADDDDDDDRTPVAGTLMGMTIEEMQARDDAQADADDDDGESTSRTSFGLPAVSRDSGDESDEAEEEDEDDQEEEYEDAPTQAWNPNSLDIGSKPDNDGRKKLLEKIRKSRPVKRETSKGIPAAKSGTQRGMKPPDGPDLSALKKLKPKRELKATPVEFPEDIRETNEQPKVPRPSNAPASGILRGPSGPKSTPEAGSDPIGKTGYKLGPGEAPKEDSKRGVPIARITPPTNDEPAEQGLDEPISDPDFGLMETDIASAELIQQAGFPSAPLDGPTEDLSAAQEELAATTPDRPVNPNIGFDETMAPGNSFPESALQPPQPTAKPQPAPPPAAAPVPQPAAPQPAPTPASSPEHVPPQFQTATNRQKTMSQGVFDTFDGGSASSPQVGLPQQPHEQSSDNDSASSDDPLVRRIQTAFGVLAGVLTLGVQLVVWLGSTPESTGGKVLLALAITLALAAIGAGAAPISTTARSGGLVVVGGILLLATIAGFAVGLPPTFLVTGLGAFVALMAAAFPTIAKYLL